MDSNISSSFCKVSFSAPDHLLFKEVVKSCSNKLYVKSLEEDDRKIIHTSLKKFKEKESFPDPKEIEKIKEIHEKNKQKYLKANKLQKNQERLQKNHESHSNIFDRIKKIIKNTFFSRISSNKIMDKANKIKESEKYKNIPEETRLPRWAQEHP